MANKQQCGPVVLRELAELFAKGKTAGGIGGDTHVWCDAMVEWRRLKETPELVQIRRVLLGRDGQVVVEEGPRVRLVAQLPHSER